MSCNFCQKKKDLPVICKVCKLVKYCSIECQRKDEHECVEFGSFDISNKKEFTEEYFKNSNIKVRINIPNIKSFFIILSSEEINEVKKLKETLSKEEQEILMNDTIRDVKKRINDVKGYRFVSYGEDDEIKDDFHELGDDGMILLGLDYPNITFEKV